MKFSEFLSRLATQRGKMQLTDGGAIRTRARSKPFQRCPINAVGGNWLVHDGAIGLSSAVRSDIMCAADFSWPNRARARDYRARMLAVLGLDGEGAAK